MTTVPAVPSPAHPQLRRGALVVALVVVALAALTITLVSAWLRPLGAGAPAEVPAQVPAAPPAYLSGGSVYDEQVPAAGLSDTYGPGSAIYDQQVPPAARGVVSTERPRFTATFPVGAPQG
ncbi:hypothetical protein [Cellulomonas sp. ICMP 17802]|uniref:hypothetical protein n=1 Tax=Cellulomonas sp. ICMP 17802 TaxID=3239199 RepID=UPI00351BA2A5